MDSALVLDTVYIDSVLVLDTVLVSQLDTELGLQLGVLVLTAKTILFYLGQAES